CAKERTVTRSFDYW
nr:immunoglobulin heavy chain junction region [Macaca mulatta]MOV49117.1 immunoglobulin heavy chain junction region [Macaca mulatta]MOV49145.1 immunoglobulin heavy chain junction region [Macaca mulatta]MOV49479.1 immunoglobulin heavy chain junction region [Macaca mulatta]MOV49821.1 immunoglobulin heavy chain junction region [Macaca mulatta]